MPSGIYERKTRGTYKKTQDFGLKTKRSLFMLDNQYYTIKHIARQNNTTYAEILRIIIDEYFKEKNIEIIDKDIDN